MARIYVIRHGNTFDKGDTVTRVGGRTDLPLSSSGQDQACALAEHFSGLIFHAAFCSLLQRTRATARAIIGMRTGSPALLILPFLTEIDYGPDENQPEDKVIARLGEAVLTAWDEDATPPDGWLVDPKALKAAWADFLHRASRLDNDADILVVTSNGIARFLPDVIQNKPEDLDRKLKTGAWGEVEITAGDARITGWNIRP